MKTRTFIAKKHSKREEGIYSDAVAVAKVADADGDGALEAEKVAVGKLHNSRLGPSL
jgi:hypothetical protein